MFDNYLQIKKPLTTNVIRGFNWIYLRALVHVFRLLNQHHFLSLGEAPGLQPVQVDT